MDVHLDARAIAARLHRPWPTVRWWAHRGWLTSAGTDADGCKVYSWQQAMTVDNHQRAVQRYGQEAVGAAAAAIEVTMTFRERFQADFTAKVHPAAVILAEAALAGAARQSQE